MSFYDFYHKYFGDNNRGYIRPPEDDDDSNAKNRPTGPLWNPDTNKNNISEFPSFFHFNVVIDPFEMHKFFEQKVNEIMGSFLSPPDGFSGLYDFGGLEPPNDPTAEDKQSLRDHYLKPGFNKPSPNNEGSGFGVIDPWKDASSWLDSKPGQEDVQDGPPSRPKIFSSFRTVVRKSVTLPDGSVKTEEIIRDSDGTERWTESHSSPDEHLDGLDSSLFGFTNIPDFFEQPKLPETKKIAPRDQYLKPGYENPSMVDEKVDKDLDIQIQVKGIESLPSLPTEPELVDPSEQQFSFKSVIRRSIRLPNGEVETEEIVKNSDGTEEISIVRTLPDGSEMSLKGSQSDNLSIGPYKNHHTGIKDWANHSHLMQGISDFINIFFK